MNTKYTNIADLAKHFREIEKLYNSLGESYKAVAFARVRGAFSSLKELEFKGNKLITPLKGMGDATKTVIEQFAMMGSSFKIEKLLAQGAKQESDELKFDFMTVKIMIDRIFEPLKNKVEWCYAGSARRGESRITDIDIVVVERNSETKKLIKQVLEMFNLKPDVRNGDEKWGVSLNVDGKRSITMDINFTSPDKRGAMLLYLTGPSQFNVAQRARAKKLGYTLNQHGLYKAGKLVASETETDIFKAIGEDFILPCFR
jgi:DNA polymerase/3'-5' exonuclease PolX